MFQTGSAILDITPPLGGLLRGHFNRRQSVGIHDPLMATAQVFSDGETQIALVGCDLIAMDLGVCNEARAIIERDCGIPRDNVMIWATHTHAGPSVTPGAHDRGDGEYAAILPRKLAGAVKMATERMADAELSVAFEREERIAFNRRYNMRDGSTRTNPGVGNPDVVSVAGPIDPDVGCLFAKREDGLDSVLVNFACHLDVLGNGNHLISADYPYYLRKTLAQAGWDSTVVAFANGACGNINHINVFSKERQGGFEHCEKMGRVLAGDVLKCVKEPARIETQKVQARRADIDLPYRPFSEDEIEQFRSIAQDEELSETDFRKLNARKHLRRLESAETSLPNEVQVFMIGELAIVGIPAEYFVEFALLIKAKSPARWTFLVELANDCVGYVPTEEGFDQGAYEGQSARFAKEAGNLMSSKVLGLLQEIAD